MRHSTLGFTTWLQPPERYLTFVKEADDVTHCKVTSMFVGCAVDIARAFGEAFWAPADYDHLAQQLQTVLEDGIAINDSRFTRVTADGSPWVTTYPLKYFGQV
jgi:hypothetical protein